MTVRRWLPWAAFALPSALIGFACLSDADIAPALFSCPAEEDPANERWPVVSQVLERKCGTLDCHGDRSRPFRLFGRNGARLSTSDVVGSTDGTTPAEYDENKASACGLEPELMSAVVEGDGSLESLTLCRKPRLLEAHKGGLVWNENSPGYVCLTSWISGNVDEAACEAELRIP